jgi:8-oxo-dGTP diphosphatase
MHEAKEETSIDVKLIDLVNVYSKPDRDPRGHTVTVAYTAKGDLSTRKADSDAKEIGIFSHDEIDDIDIAFDHRQIINDCLKKAKK